jgi:hypothetical protein
VEDGCTRTQDFGNRITGPQHGRSRPQFAAPVRRLRRLDRPRGVHFSLEVFAERSPRMRLDNAVPPGCVWRNDDQARQVRFERSEDVTNAQVPRCLDCAAVLTAPWTGHAPKCPNGAGGSKSWASSSRDPGSMSSTQSAAMTIGSRA